MKTIINNNWQRGENAVLYLLYMMEESVILDEKICLESFAIDNNTQIDRVERILYDGHGRITNIEANFNQHYQLANSILFPDVETTEILKKVVGVLSENKDPRIQSIVNFLNTNKGSKVLEVFPHLKTIKKHQLKICLAGLDICLLDNNYRPVSNKVLSDIKEEISLISINIKDNFNLIEQLFWDNLSDHNNIKELLCSIFPDQEIYLNNENNEIRLEHTKMIKELIDVSNSRSMINFDEVEIIINVLNSDDKLPNIYKYYRFYHSGKSIRQYFDYSLAQDSLKILSAIIQKYLSIITTIFSGEIEVKLRLNQGEKEIIQNNIFKSKI